MFPKSIFENKPAVWVIVVLIGFLVVGYIALSRAGSGDPVYAEADVAEAGFTTESRSVHEGEYGDMVELHGEFNDSQAIVVLHTGNEQGWLPDAVTGTTESEALLRQAIANVNGSTWAVDRAENAWVGCPTGRPCTEFTTELFLNRISR
ncbi:MAG: hypothetical protein WD333_11955 [Dehalococcoidia bacterium]